MVTILHLSHKSIQCSYLCSNSSRLFGQSVIMCMRQSMEASAKRLRCGSCKRFTAENPCSTLEVLVVIKRANLNI